MTSKFLTNDDVEIFKNFIIENNFVQQYPHWLWNNYNPDIMLKWGGILKYVKSVSDKNSIILDLACGDSPVPKIISNWCKEIHSFDAYKNQSSIDNFKFFSGNHIQFLNNIQENLYDIVYDSCSSIHFDVSHNESNQIYNNGFYYTLQKVKYSLKPNGKFFIICDCGNHECGEIFKASNMYKMIENVDFKFLGDVNLDKPKYIFSGSNPMELNVVSFSLTKNQ
jgi:hypothetical protein